MVIVPLVLLTVLLALAGGAWAYIDQHFDKINSVSTPPPVVTGSQLGGDDKIQVDTGPAQEAVRRAQEAESGKATEEPSGAAGQYSNGKAFMAFSMQGEASATPNGDNTFQLPKTDTGDAVLVLLMGVDARPGEAIDVGVRPDTLVVLNLDPATDSCRMLAIPRDSRVDLPGYGASKINHALAIGGIPYEQLVVENLLGISFDHYGLIDFGGVENLVDELGGITIDNETAFSVDGQEFPVGEQKLNGEQALDYVRYRGAEDGDFGRQERQQDVVRAMLRQGADMEVVTALPRLLDAIDDHVRTDADVSTLIDLGKEFHSTCTAESLDTMSITGDVAMMHDAVFDEPLSFVVLQPSEVEEKLHWLLTGEAPPSATPETSPAAEATPAA
jgi:LCP family protein required for cell wall assembly